MNARALLVREFDFEWSEGYSVQQDQFQHVLASGDPDALMGLWASQPCHVDTMLQLSEYLRMTGQRQHAVELVQRYPTPHAFPR